MNQSEISVSKDLEMFKNTAERIYYEWDAALASNNVEALLALYAPDAILESPLVSHLMGTETGICNGREELRRLLEILVKRKPAIRQYYRAGYFYFTDGKTLMWEYPRATPHDDQMDFVEVMELKDGLIQHHKVYWGWLGFHVINNDEYHR